MTESQHPTTPPTNVSDILPSPVTSGGKIYNGVGDHLGDEVSSIEKSQDPAGSHIRTESPRSEEYEIKKIAEPHLDASSNHVDKKINHTTFTNSDINDLGRFEESSAHDAVSSPKSEEARLRSLIAHYELQNKLLTIESYENAQRYEVETSIMQREIDRLLMERPPLVDEEDDSEMLSSRYRRRLRKAKLKLKDAAEVIREKDEEIERLKSRLRQGWQHREAMENQRNPKDEPQTPKTGLTALGILASQALSHGSGNSRRSSGSTVTEDDGTDEDEEAPSMAQDEENDKVRENRETGRIEGQSDDEEIEEGASVEMEENAQSVRPDETAAAEENTGESMTENKEKETSREVILEESNDD